MPYVPFSIRCYEALSAALAANFNAELEAVGQPAMAEMGFQAGTPQLTAGESVVLTYAKMERALMTKHWVDGTALFVIELTGLGATAHDRNLRLMYMEFAATQVIQKNHTLGGLLRTIEVGDSEPWKISQGQQGFMFDSLLLPIACQPDTRVPNPERSLP